MTSTKVQKRLLDLTLLRILPVAALCLLSVWYTARNITKTAVKKEVVRTLKEQADYAAHLTSIKLATVRDAARAKAENELIKNGIIDTVGRDAYLPQFFRALRLPGPAEASITLTDYRGRTVASNQKDLSYHDAPWVAGVMRGEELFRLTADGLLIAVPVNISGLPEGMIVVEYGPDKIPDLVHPDADVETLVVYDERGRVIFSTDPGFAEQGSQVPGEEVEGWFQTRKSLHKFQGLSLVVAKREAEAFEPVRSLDRYLIIVLLLSLVILTMGIVLTARTATTPLYAFIRKLRDIKGHESLEEVHLPEDGPAEFLELSSAFNNLAGELRQRHEELETEVADRKRAEEEVEKARQTQNLLNTLLRISLEDISLQGLLERALDVVLAAQVLPVERRASIFLVEDEPEVLVLKVNRGLLDPTRSNCARVPFGHCICGKAAATGQTQFSAHDYELHQPSAENRAPHGHYAVPIISKGQTIGVILTYVKAGHTRDQREVEFLETVANTLTGIIQRKRAEDAVRQAKEFYEQILGEAGDAIIALRQDGTIITWNSGAERIFGWEEKEMLDRHYGEVQPEEVISEIDDKLKQTFAGKELMNFEMRFLRKDGLWIDSLITATPVYDERGDIIATLAVIKDITDRKRAEEDLRRANQELELLYRAARTSTRSVDLAEALRFIVQETPPFIGATQGFVLLLDEATSELVGVAASEPYDEAFRRVRISLDEPSAAAWVLTNDKAYVSSRSIQDARLSKRLVERFRVSSAVFLPLKLRNQTLGVLIYSHDHKEGAFDDLDRAVLSRITDQMSLAVFNAKLFEQAKEGKDYLETLIEHSMDAIISTDAHGIVRLFNSGAERMLGYKQEEILGERVEVIYGDLQQAKAVMQAMYGEGGSVTNFETVLRHKGGYYKPVLISATQLKDASGRVIGTVGYSKDITEIKQAEEELKKAHKELGRAYRALENAQVQAIVTEKLAALGRLTAGATHEILNPLNIMNLVLHMLLEEESLPEGVKDDLRTLKLQGERIKQITQGLIHFSRQQPPKRKSLALNTMVSTVVGVIAPELKLQQVDLRLSLEPGLPPILGDQDQLEQVLLHLLANARDAMPQGGRLAVATRVVKSKGMRFVELRVEDSGPGIPAGIRDKIFEPFFTTKPEGQGTGLGLSISQGIVESHGGFIWAESGQKGGTTFCVRLKAEDSDEPAERTELFDPSPCQLSNH